MEKHFLDDMMKDQGPPTFQAEPWYNPHGDCIVYQLADEAIIANRVDELLTMYESAINGRPIGFQIKGVRAIISKFGFNGLQVTSDCDTDTVKNVSIKVLLLAAYEGGPRTFARRQAYALAMDYPSDLSIRTDELQMA